MYFECRPLLGLSFLIATTHCHLNSRNAPLCLQNARDVSAAPNTMNRIRKTRHGLPRFVSSQWQRPTTRVRFHGRSKKMTE